MKKQQEEADRAMKELLEEEQSKAAREAAVKKKKEGKNEKDRRKKVAEEEARKKKEHEEKEKEKLEVQNKNNTAPDDNEEEEEQDGAMKFQARLSSSAGRGEGCAADDEPYDEEQALQRALKASMEDVDQDKYGGRPSDDESRDLFLAKDREKQRMVFDEPPKPIPSGDYQARETGTYGGVVDVRVNKTPSKAPRGGAGGDAVGGGFFGGGQTSGVGLEASDLGRPRGPGDKFCGVVKSAYWQPADRDKMGKGRITGYFFVMGDGLPEKGLYCPANDYKDWLLQMIGGKHSEKSSAYNIFVSLEMIGARHSQLSTASTPHLLFENACALESLTFQNFCILLAGIKTPSQLGDMAFEQVKDALGHILETEVSGEIIATPVQGKIEGRSLSFDGLLKVCLCVCCLCLCLCVRLD